MLWLLQAGLLTLLFLAINEGGLLVFFGFVCGCLFIFLLVPARRSAASPEGAATDLAKPTDMSHRQTSSYRQLVRCCGGRTDVADRLVAYEMVLNRQLTPHSATVEALDRLLIDRRARY